MTKKSSPIRDRTGIDRLLMVTAISPRMRSTSAAAPTATQRKPVSARLPLPWRLIGWVAMIG